MNISSLATVNSLSCDAVGDMSPADCVCVCVCSYWSLVQISGESASFWGKSYFTRMTPLWMTFYSNHFFLNMEVKQNMNNQSMLCTLWMKQPWLLIQSSRFWKKRMFGGQSCSKWWRELTFEPHAKLSFCLRAEWKWQDGVCFPNYAITKRT